MKTFTLRCADPSKEIIEGVRFDKGLVFLDTGKAFAGWISLKEWMKEQKPQYMMEDPGFSL